MEQFSNRTFLKWSISQMEQFSNRTFLKWSISQMKQFSNRTFLKWSISQMEHFSNGAILKSNISQMEQFSNGAFWGRHPMPYFKIPRTEKYGMQCARSNTSSSAPEKLANGASRRFNSSENLLSNETTCDGVIFPATGEFWWFQLSHMREKEHLLLVRV